jgi:DNA-binding FadR family transcriptional regulator
LESFQHEHRAVAAAIELQDARAARETIRRHLANGQQRYRRLAKEAKALTGPPLTR